MTTQSTLQPLRIGLTGGIGSGKSTVASLLAGHGAAVIDSDAIARRLTEPGGAAIDALRSAFGPQFIDDSGALDRDRMRALVFSDTSAKQRLEQILHPLIFEQTEQQSRLSAESVKVFDVPLLVESKHWRKRVDRVWVVDCLEQTQVERVVSRSGWTTDAVHAVLGRQASRAQRRAAADDVIFNDGIGLDQLARQVEQLWRRLCTR
ncbi:dephospho-CoA kinase [Piscinibacter sakaiensis]|uniref:dephospho-CoA kinase n=1 Tax=Piscinibacter sakaiensis TaxID=1547922 RepID=UPI003AAE2BEF